MSEQQKDDKNKSNSGSHLTAGDKLYLGAQIPMAFLGAGMVSDAMQNHLSPDVPASVVIAHADNELAKLKAKDMSPEDYYKKSQEIKDGLAEQVSDNNKVLSARQKKSTEHATIAGIGAALGLPFVGFGANVVRRKEAAKKRAIEEGGQGI